MRTKFAAGANDLDATVDETEIDAYLNRAFRYYVTPDVGGDFARGTATVFTQAGTTAYLRTSDIVAYASELTAWIREGSSIHYLSVETDHGRWEATQAGDPARQGRPSTMLASSNSLLFWPTPDAVYAVNIPSVRNQAFDFNSATGITFMENDAWAMSVIHAALMEYHDETQDEVSYQRAMREYKRWRKHLKRMTHGRPNRRHRARSY